MIDETILKFKKMEKTEYNWKIFYDFFILHSEKMEEIDLDEKFDLEKKKYISKIDELKEKILKEFSSIKEAK